jgi:hypothetical protein
VMDSTTLVWLWVGIALIVLVALVSYLINK